MHSNKIDIELIEKSQEQIWHLHIEISGYSAFFKNLEKSDFSASEFYGISLMLQCISKRLQKISDQLL